MRSRISTGRYLGEQVTWQRCQTHLARDVLEATPKSLRLEMLVHLRTLFEAPICPRLALLQQLLATFASCAPTAMVTLEAGFDDATAVLALPEPYRRRLRTSNGKERLNEEVLRRECVIRIFPNRESAIRLLGAVLWERHEQWTTGKACWRRFFSAVSMFTSWWRRSTRALKAWAAVSGQRMRRGLECLGKMRQDSRIDGIGLGQPSGRLGEVTHLARIDDRHPQLGEGQRRGHQPFQATGGLQHNQVRATACRRSTNAAMPVSSLLLCHACPLGRTATSRVALLTSMPT